MSLQYAASVKSGEGTASTTTVEGDAFKVAESGDDLNLYQTLNSTVEVVEGDDLNALADGEVAAKTSVTYT
jgi:hypothetical protein